LAITGYRGQFFNFTFNYTRDSDNYTILNAQISNTTDLPPGLEITDITLITDTEGNDYYLLKIDTTNLEAQSNPYHVNLSVYNTIGYDSQSIDLILHVLRPKFTVLELTNNLDLFNISNANVNLTIKFKIWDTIKKQYNDTLTSNNITVSMDGVIWNRSDTTFDNGGYFLKIVNTDTHEYSLNISTLGLIFGKKYDLQINITYESLVLDSYQNCSLNVSFYYGHMNTSIEYFDELTITGYRGQLLNFTFNFTRDSDDSFITGATLHLDDAVDGLEFELLEETNQYILSLNTTGMDARTTPYYLNFTVYYDNHQSQFINISLTVLLPLIEVINLEVNLGEFDVINENTNVTLTFKVNDTLNNELITSLSTENITVIEGSNTWGRGDGSFENGGYELYYNDTGQYYILNISTLGLSPGQEYHLIINITYMSPNGPYNYSIIELSFYYNLLNTSIEYLDELTITGYRGQLFNFTFNFTRDSDDSFITGANLHLDDAVDGLEFELLEMPNQYILSLNTTGMDARTTPYYLNFTVYYNNHQNQFINISLTVLLPRIEMIESSDNLYPNGTISAGINVTLTFKVNDTLNNELITSLSTENITVIEGSNPWDRGDGSFENGGYELYYNDTGQYYILNISTLGLSPGQEYHLIINITYMSPNGPYNYTFFILNFYYDTDPSYYETNVILLDGESLQGYREEIIEFSFNYTREDGTIFIPGAVIKNSTDLPPGFQYELIEGSNNYTLLINTTNMIARSTPYRINFTLSKGLYQRYYLNLTLLVLLPRTEVIDYINNLDENIVIALGSNITIQFKLRDTLHDNYILTLTTDNISIINRETGFPWIIGYEFYHDGNGNYTLDILTTGLIEGNKYNILINITYSSPNPGPYNYTIIELEFYYGYNPNVINGGSTGGGGGSSGGGGGGGSNNGTTEEEPPSSPPNEQLILEDFIPFIIIGAIVIGAVGGGYIIYKKKVVPKKVAEKIALEKKKALIEDAKAIELLMIVHKEAGLCIFSKEFMPEIIDPNLITGFLTAISSFGQELKIKDELNEIKYKEKVLLLADGNYIRATLILNKSPSVYLYDRLRQFIEAFEQKYAQELPIFLTELRGRVSVFKNNDDLIATILPEVLEVHEQEGKETIDSNSNLKDKEEEAGKSEENLEVLNHSKDNDNDNNAS